MADDPILDIKQAAIVLTDELGRIYSENNVRKAVDAGKLPFYADPISRRRVIRKSLLLAAWKIAESQAMGKWQKREKVKA